MISAPEVMVQRIPRRNFAEGVCQSMEAVIYR
jgi:hypothetical protein